MSKPPGQRAPFNAPPSADALAARGLELMRTFRGPKGEDGSTALKRARTMPWGSRIVSETPFMAGAMWMWVCCKEAA
jgi:hypothetical protein